MVVRGSACEAASYTSRSGPRALIRWMRSFSGIARIGVEGTGSYGAGITRHLADAGIEVLEVDAAGEFCWPPGQAIDDDRLERSAAAWSCGRREAAAQARPGDRRSGQLCV